MKKYAFEINDPANTVKARIDNAHVSFKNTRETSRVLINKSIAEAEKYLKAVIKKQRCVPMRRYARGVGRTAQAKEFKTDRGRWPVKSCKFILDLLQNLRGNASFKGIDPSTILIANIIVNKARIVHGRLHRAHGRINQYNKHPCHIQIVGIKKVVFVPKGGDSVVKTATA